MDRSAADSTRGDFPVSAQSTGFGEGLDKLAREMGGWPNTYIVHTIEVIGQGDDPLVLLEGSAGDWSAKEKRIKYSGPKMKAVVLLSEYKKSFSADEVAA